MLQGIKKLVGPKSDDELQIQRYKEILQKRSEPSPELHLKIGRLYEKIGEKADAGIEYKQAAQLYMERNEYVGALVANKLLIRLDREDADANANVAFIELQQGVKLSSLEFNTFLQDLGQPLSHATQQQDPSGKKRPTSRLALSRDNRRRQQKKNDPAFQADRQQLLDLIAGDADAEERFDASFDVERHKEEFDTDTFNETSQKAESDVASQNTDKSDDIDDIPFIDLTTEEIPGERMGVGESSGEENASGGMSQAATSGDQPLGKEHSKKSVRPDARELLSRLDRVPLFSCLSGEELVQLHQHVHLHEMSEGMPIRQTADEQQSLFVLLNGAVELNLEGPHAARAPELYLLQTGDFWGEHAFLGQSGFRLSAQAKSSGAIAQIPKTFLALAAKKHPSLLDLLKTTCKRRCFSPFLRRVAIFEELNAEEVQKVAEHLFTKEMKKGSILIREGEYGDSIFLIESGKVEVHMSFMEREELHVLKTEQEHVHLTYLQEGDFFGEGAYFTQEPRSATIVAQTDGRLLKLPGSHLKKLLREYPQIELSLQKYHQQRIQVTMKTIQSELS